MRESSLKTMLRRVLRAALVAPVALGGCGPDTTGYSAPECTENGELAVSGLAPSVIPDVVQLREVSNFGSDRQMPRLVSQSGSVCATATDKPTCEASLAALAPASGFRQDCLQICLDSHLATTKGDEVSAITTLDDLKAFLGPIDTPQEALLLVYANGFNVRCGALDRGAVRPSGDGYDVIATRGFACGPGTAVTRDFLKVSRTGVVSETGSEVIERGDPNCAIGRRPPGLASSGQSDCDEAIGRFFAEAAHLEAAAVPAFERLELELTRLGAPEALVHHARRSVLEEVRHVRLTAGLARRFGAEPTAPEVEERPLRSLFELALDNATEGCVRETFGALVAHHQAAAAADEEVRAALATIADDETHHAELSWAIDAWARSQLSPEQCAALDAAQLDALEALREGLAAPVSREVALVAGLPDGVQAQALLRAMEAELRLAA
jgi:hypothetical protein